MLFMFMTSLLVSVASSLSFLSSTRRASAATLVISSLIPSGSPQLRQRLLTVDSDNRLRRIPLDHKVLIFQCATELG